MRQIVFYVIGAGLMVSIMYFDLEQLEKLSLYVLIAGVLSLLLYVWRRNPSRRLKRSEELV